MIVEIVCKYGTNVMRIMIIFVYVVLHRVLSQGISVSVILRYGEYNNDL